MREVRTFSFKDARACTRRRLGEAGFYRGENNETLQLFFDELVSHLPYTSADGKLDPLGTVMTLLQTHFIAGNDLTEIVKFDAAYFPKLMEVLLCEPDSEETNRKLTEAQTYHEQLMLYLGLVTVNKETH